MLTPKLTTFTLLCATIKHMRKGRFGALTFTALFVALLVGAGITSQQVLAQTSKSPNYQMTESEIGNTAGGESCSGNYCSQVTVGNDSAASSASSPELGTVKYGEPMIELSVNAGASSLGQLSTERTGLKQIGLQIRNYETGGFRVQVVGTPPKYGDHTLSALASPASSSPGTEQFGINVVANTSPSVGVNPVLQPGGGDATGLVMSGYNTPNRFKYVSGETVAQTTANTGGADLTISMIVNISNTTPAGHYSGDYAAIVIPYF